MTTRVVEMAQDFSVKIDDNVRKFAEKFAAQLGPVISMGMLQAADQMRQSVAQSTTSLLNKNSKGKLSNSWTPGPLITSANKFSINVFSMVPYASIHETGGVIKPKRVKALAIPDRSYSPIMRNNAPIAPRDFDPGRTKLDFMPVKNPGRIRGLLVDKDTGQRAYTLVASSKIYPTSYMSIAVEKALPEIKLTIEGVLEAAKVAAAGAA